MVQVVSRLCLRAWRLRIVNVVPMRAYAAQIRVGDVDMCKHFC